MEYKNEKKRRKLIENIMAYADNGYPPASIAKIFKIKRPNTVSVIIHRERVKASKT